MEQGAPTQATRPQATEGMGARRDSARSTCGGVGSPGRFLLGLERDGGLKAALRMGSGVRDPQRASVAQGGGRAPWRSDPPRLVPQISRDRGISAGEEPGA